MLRRIFGKPHPPGSPHADSPAPAAGRSVRLPILGWTRVAFLAGLAAALVVLTSEPAPHQEEAPAWAMRIERPSRLGSMALAPDGRRLATGGEDRAVALWEVGGGAERELPAVPARAVLHLAFSADGATLAAGDCDATVTIWEVATAQKRAILRGHSGSVPCLAFSPDGKTLATGSSPDRRLRLWDLATGEVKAIGVGHRSAVCAVRFSPDGRTLASGDAGGLVKLWGVGDGRVQERHGARIHETMPVSCLAFSPDGSLVASGSVNDGLKLWDVATGVVCGMPATEHDVTQGVSFSSDGRTLIAATAAGVIQLWDVAERRRIAALRAGSELDCVALTADGRFVAAAGADGVVRVWDLAPPPAAGREGESKKDVPDR